MICGRCGDPVCTRCYHCTFEHHTYLDGCILPGCYCQAIELDDEEL